MLVSALITVVMIAVFTSLQTVTDDFDDFGIDEPSITESDGTEAGDGVGSIEQPAAIGDTITFTDYAEVDEWQVVVGDPALDATADVLAADEFNLEPAAGSQYVVVPLVYSYLGAESGYPFIGASPEFVGSDGASYSVTYATYPGVPLRRTRADPRRSGARQRRVRGTEHRGRGRPAEADLDLRRQHLRRRRLRAA